MRTVTSVRAITAALLVAVSSGALAHHPLGGETPTTFLHGFLSGIGHPVIGFDHLVFLIAAGVLGWVLGRPLLLAGSFVVASLVAVFVAHAGAVLPMIETMVLISMFVAGFCLALKFQPAIPVALLFFILAGMAHGGAYGGAIVGAEQTPLVAYLMGIGLIQIVLVALAVFLVTALSQREREPQLAARLIGAVVVGVALTIGFESLEAAVLPLLVS